MIIYSVNHLDEIQCGTKKLTPILVPLTRFEWIKTCRYYVWVCTRIKNMRSKGCNHFKTNVIKIS